MNKKLLLAILLVITVAIVTGVWFFRTPTKPPIYAGPVTTVRVGAGFALDITPFWVAERNGYFKEEGLNVELTEFGSGRSALQAMLSKNNLDLVTVGPTPVVINSFDHDNYVIIAGIAYYDDIKILAREDSRIHTTRDLKGKKVGITIGSTGHYFLNLFLARSSLTLRDVKIINLDGTDLPGALADGRVDAIATWEPNISNASKLLNGRSLLLESKDVFRDDTYLVARKSWVKNNPELAKSLLRAISKAQTFIEQHKDESINIATERLKSDKVSIASAWKDYSLVLFLDQAILLTLEQQARWAKTNNLISATATTPNYLDFIYFDGLEAVKPEAVTIIR